MAFGVWPIVVSLIMACWVLFLSVTTLIDLRPHVYSDLKMYKRHRSLVLFLIFSQAVAVGWVSIRLIIRMGLF